MYRLFGFIPSQRYNLETRLFPHRHTISTYLSIVSSPTSTNSQLLGDLYIDKRPFVTSHLLFARGQRISIA